MGWVIPFKYVHWNDHNLNTFTYDFICLLPGCYINIRAASRSRQSCTAQYDSFGSRPKYVMKAGQSDA